MIVGSVTDSREATVRLKVRGPSGVERELAAVIDTGFNDQLTLPAHLISELCLPYAAPTQATLAGGQVVEVDYFSATIEWEVHVRTIMVLELAGTPLIGMGLLDGHRLTLDAVPEGKVTIESLPV